jgi:hypothetical protein
VQALRPDPLRPDLRHVLDDLRGRIRRYVVIEGVSAVLVVLCLLFWFSLTLDAVHFEVRKLELPGWFRTAFIVLMAAVFALSLAAWVLSRVLRGFRARALALVLEKRFPQLGDRLITAVELSDRPQAAKTELGGAMLERTVADAAEQARGLDLSRVFDPVPLRRWLTGAAVLVASVVAFGVTNAQALDRWFHAFVLLDDDYWEPYRRSAMTVKVVTQPGDRVREFDANHTYKHPRGADLTLLAQVPDGRAVPADVTLRFRTRGGAGTSRGSAPMSAMTERQFRHTLGRVIDPHDLWVIGGDFVNRDPYHVKIVDPPQLDRIVLRCDYPDYTGMDALADKERVVQGAQISLPEETRFVLRAQANKPLVGVTIRCEHFDLQFNKLPRDSGDTRLDRSELTLRAKDAAPRIVLLGGGFGRVAIAEDRLSFEVGFALAGNAAEMLGGIQDGDFTWLPLPPGTPLQIYLEDADEISSADPTLLTINGIPDLEPVVDTKLRGIGTSITRMARIPVEGTISDDYGVVSARFGHRVDSDAEYAERPLASPPQGQKEFTLSESGDERVERFNVLPLELKLEQKLALTVFAEDGDNLNGPHVSHGEVFAFRIVSPEDLLSILYDKELNLRLRFEQIRDEVDNVREDLLLHRERYEEGRALAASPPADDAKDEWQERLRQIQVNVHACAERNLHLIRKGHTETTAVAAAFGEIREEMVNNRVDTASALQRIDFGILQPLQQINTEDFPFIDGQLGLFRLANEQGSSPAGPIDSAVAAIDALRIRMDRVLAEMQERRDYNAVIQMLQEILDRQQRLRESTQKEQERKLFDLLK